MKPAESFVGQPVRALQTMLRTIASIEPDQVNVMPDGIYGPQTAQAVRSLQRRMGLTVTGAADPATHGQIVQAYERAWVEAGRAQPLQITLDPGQIIRRGERHHTVYLVQSMLTVLSQATPTIPAPGHTGILDPQTAESLAVFQTWAQLPPTGELDKGTWKNLALQYALAADWLENRDDL